MKTEPLHFKVFYVHRIGMWEIRISSVMEDTPNTEAPWPHPVEKRSHGLTFMYTDVFDMSKCCPKCLLSCWFLTFGMQGSYFSLLAWLRDHRRADFHPFYRLSRENWTCCSRNFDMGAEINKCVEEILHPIKIICTRINGKGFKWRGHLLWPCPLSNFFPLRGHFFISLWIWVFEVSVEPSRGPLGCCRKIFSVWPPGAPRGVENCLKNEFLGRPWSSRLESEKDVFRL